MELGVASRVEYRVVVWVRDTVRLKERCHCRLRRMRPFVDEKRQEPLRAFLPSTFQIHTF